MTIVDTYTIEISWENLNVIQKKKKGKCMGDACFN